MTGIPEDTQTLRCIPLDEVIPTEALEEQPLTLAKHQQRLTNVSSEMTMIQYMETTR